MRSSICSKGMFECFCLFCTDILQLSLYLIHLPMPYSHRKEFRLDTVGHKTNFYIYHLYKHIHFSGWQKGKESFDTYPFSAYSSTKWYIYNSFFLQRLYKMVFKMVLETSLDNDEYIWICFGCFITIEKNSLLFTNTNHGGENFLLVISTLANANKQASFLVILRETVFLCF